MLLLVAKSCPSLSNPMDSSPPVSSVCGISQTRILQWVAISFSRRSSLPRNRTHVSCLLADSLPLSHLGSLRRGMHASNIHPAIYINCKQNSGLALCKGRLKNKLPGGKRVLLQGIELFCILIIVVASQKCVSLKASQICAIYCT